MKSKEYANFEDLAKHEKGFYSIKTTHRHSSIVIIAPHAGTIEPGTEKIAREIAWNVYSLYRFVGHRMEFKEEPGRGRRRSMHLASHKFNEPEAVRLVELHELALSVHGLSDSAADANKLPENLKSLGIYVGGLNKDARTKVVANLRCFGFKVADCTGVSSEVFYCQGLEPENIVNQCKRKEGVQLEITRRERDKLTSEEVRMNSFCDAIRNALDSLA